MCSHSHSVCFMSLIHWMAYKGNLLPFSFLSRSQLPWQASESRVVLYCKVLTSRLGFWFKKKKKKRKFSAIQRAYGVYLFCDRFLSLGRKMLLYLKWMLTPSFHRSSLLFFFCMGNRLRGRGDKTAKEIFLLHVYPCMFIWNSIFSPLGMLSPNKQHDELLMLYFWLPILAFPAPSAPNLWLYAGCFLLRFGLQQGSWKINSY